MPNIGPLELIVVLVVVLMVFGPKRLPGLGKQLGSGMREFKDSIAGKDSDDEKDEKSALAPGPAQTPSPTPSDEGSTPEAEKVAEPSSRTGE